MKTKNLLKKAFLLLALMGGASSAWADTTIFSWAANSSSAKNTREAATTGGYATPGGGALETSSVLSNGYQVKLDGDASDSNSKNIFIELSGNTLQAGDIISVTAYTGSSPSDSKPYGVILSAAKNGTNAVTPARLTQKNKEETQTYTVSSLDCLYDQSSFYITRVNSYSVYVGSVTITRPAPACTDVAAPTGLSCTEQTKNSLTFSWTVASNASSYDVTLYSDSECTSQVATDNVTATSKVFTGLSGSTTYYCKVQSKGDGTTYCEDGNVTDAASGTTAAKDYTVTAETNNVSYGSAAAEAGSLDEGETTDITATPESGYKFVSWEVSGTGASLSSTTTNPTTLTMGTADATVTATFSALEHYTIKYYKGAYGGGDAIDDGDKTEGVAFTLSSARYTRDGYIQTGWSTTDGGSKAYGMGGSYTVDANLNLYPVWTANQLSDVSEETTWNWSDITSGEVNLSGSSVYRTDDVLFSNISEYGFTITSPASFKQNALMVNADYAVRSQKIGSTTYKIMQGQAVKFHTTVPGTVDVDFSNTGGDRPNRYLCVNGVQTTFGSDVANAITNATNIYVPAGDVVLTCVVDPESAGDDAGKASFLRFFKVKFTPGTKLNGSGYATFSAGTDMHIESGAKAYKATLDFANNLINCEEIEDGNIPAGAGVLLYGDANTQVVMTTTADIAALSYNDLKGTTQADGALATKGSNDYYALSGDTFMEYTGVAFVHNKAYFEVYEGAVQARSMRIVFGGVTGVANVEAASEAKAQEGKFIENGKLVIFKNGKKFNANGARLY